MLRRFALALMLLLGAASAVQAQSTSGNVGNTQMVRFTGAPSGTCLPNQVAVNNSNDDFYVCDSGTLLWVKVSSSGGGGTPGSPSGSVQYNNSGAFGGIAGLGGNNSDCDGIGDSCMLNPVSTAGGTTPFIMYGTNSAGAMGNYFDFYQFTDGSVFLDASDGTAVAGLSLGADWYIYVNNGSGLQTGVNSDVASKALQIGRLTFDSTYTTGIDAMAFSLDAGWGSTASVTSSQGGDNNFSFVVTTGGSGIAANPTAVFTYVDGDFSVGSSSSPVYICNQVGGNDIIADVTRSVTQTAVTLTWHGTPTTGKTYELGCVGFQRN